MERLFKDKYFALLVIVLIGVGFVFYWSSIRPEQIKTYCYKETYLSSDAPNPFAIPNSSVFATEYQNCLTAHGQ